MFDHVPGNIELGAMTVIKPEPVEKGSHLLDISLHVLPGIGGVNGFLPISYSNKIPPYVDSPSEIIELLGECKVLSTVGTSHPSVIEGVEALSLGFFYGGLVLGNSGEVLRNEGEGISKLSVIVVQIVVPDLVHGVKDYLWDPLLPDLLYPVVVEVVDGHLQVGHLVGGVKLLPLVYVQELDLAFLHALLADVALDELPDDVDRVLGEQVLRGLTRCHC